MTEKPVSTRSTPQRFVFVLVEGFTLLSFAGAVDALRIANRAAGRTLYEWVIMGEGGQTITSSAGPSFNLDSDLGELRRDDTVIICSGVDVQTHC